MEEHKNNKNVKTVPLPVYSKIKMVNGHIIALVEDVIETPVEWLKDGDKDG